ncbi:Transporter, partial [Gryllus bimaculatus]
MRVNNTLNDGVLSFLPLSSTQLSDLSDICRLDSRPTLPALEEGPPLVAFPLPPKDFPPPRWPPYVCGPPGPLERRCIILLVVIAFAVKYSFLKTLIPGCAPNEFSTYYCHYRLINSTPENTTPHLLFGLTLPPRSSSHSAQDSERSWRSPATTSSTTTATGLDSTFGGLEAMITALCDEYPRLLGRHRELFVGGLLVFVYICSLPTTTYGGVYLVNLLNTYGPSISILFVVFV